MLWKTQAPHCKDTSNRGGLKANCTFLVSFHNASPAVRQQKDVSAMNFNRLGTGFCTLALLTWASAGAAVAQDSGPKSGLRIGAFLGGTFAGFDATETPLVPPPPPGVDGSASLDSFAGGITIGWDQRVSPNWVAGIEGDISWFNGTSRYSGHDWNSDHMETLRARLGYLVQPDLLVYGTAGIAWLDLEYSGFVVPPAPIVSASDTAFGWTVGAGGEYQMGAYALFAEYLYANFNTWDFDGATDHYSIDPDAHIIRGGIKVRL